jgi:CheY-like chemotaxis protein
VFSPEHHRSSNLTARGVGSTTPVPTLGFAIRDEETIGVRYVCGARTRIVCWDTDPEIFAKLKWSLGCTSLIRIPIVSARDPSLPSFLTARLLREQFARRQLLSGDVVPLDGARVLIVEDDPALCGLLERLLVAEGCAVRTASEGPEALRLVHEDPPHLIVLDLMLPWMNGIEVLATVRQQPMLSHVPVLVTTGTATSAFDLRSFGHVRVLHKPLAIESFVTTVRRMLSSSES